MGDRALTPHITVTIGQQTRVYFALVTTAPTSLDAAGTVTLQLGMLAELGRLAATLENYDRVRVPARLILVEALDLAWYRARCYGHQHLLLPADPVLVGAEPLQGWLWQRLEKFCPQQAVA
jgi:hypothetical protein